MPRKPRKVKIKINAWENSGFCDTHPLNPRIIYKGNYEDENGMWVYETPFVKKMVEEGVFVVTDTEDKKSSGSGDDTSKSPKGHTGKKRGDK